VLNKQPLLAPRPLELSPTEELTVRWGASWVGGPAARKLPCRWVVTCAAQLGKGLHTLTLGSEPVVDAFPAPHRDHLDVFQANGFDFTDDPATGRLLLAAVPFRCLLTSF
jgi:hypothetical protein